MERIELPTFGLQNRCTTAVLHRLSVLLRSALVIAGAHYSARRAAHNSGALGVFTVLAAFMYLTRHIDWFDVTFGKKADDGSRVQLHA